MVITLTIGMTAGILLGYVSEKVHGDFLLDGREKLLLAVLTAAIYAVCHLKFGSFNKIPMNYLIAFTIGADVFMTDLKQHRVYVTSYWLLFVLGALLVAYDLMSGNFKIAQSHLLGAGAALLITLVFYKLAGMGSGDVYYYSALALFFNSKVTLKSFICFLAISTVWISYLLIFDRKKLDGALPLCPLITLAMLTSTYLYG